MTVQRPNILLSKITELVQYRASGHKFNAKYPDRVDPVAHARSLKQKLRVIEEQIRCQQQIDEIKTKGVYLEFSGMHNFELATKSLENISKGIHLLNIQNIDGCIKATVYIPEERKDFFWNRIDSYEKEKTKKGFPKNNDLVSSIEDIKLAILESFWTDKFDCIPDEIPVNCEIWIRYNANKNETNSHNIEKNFHSICDELNIYVDKGKRIIFPERMVKVIKANRANLKYLLMTCEYIAEIRRATEPTSFFTRLHNSEKREWNEDLLSRCTFNDSRVSICLLDTGLNGEHPLISPAVLNKGLHSVKDEWGTNDNKNTKGHGTEMAGVALYNDLQEALESFSSIVINHKIESVKILPDRGQNPETLYGAITQDAVSIAEIDNPNEKRVICMAITAKNDIDNPEEGGKPSSWSAALDNITSGATLEGDNKQQLFLVSAGNIEPESFKNSPYPNRNTIEMVQNPGQSWNAITVGGYADKINIEDKDFQGFSPLAPRGGISPYSSTSVSWKNKWPIKPEVLFASGNIATNKFDYWPCDDLSLLTTGFEPHKDLYSTIYATSAATAQAANFSAKLLVEYPDFWPETIRALMIHSADWTDEMYRQFCPNYLTSTKQQRRNLLRHCGYGIPDLDKAIQCKNNSVNMIVQEIIQPFKMENSSVKMNEMHIHAFPWPKETLLELGALEIKLRVTLSYYIEPSPGEIGWKDKYKYPSCGLRFEINDANQSLDEFKVSINNIARKENNNEENVINSSPRNKWYLGPNNRNVGSIHSDFILSSAIDLCNSRYIAIFPVGGWWKERPYLGKSENKVRYSLVVSLSTPESNIDLYTPIINEIRNMIPINLFISP